MRNRNGIVLTLAGILLLAVLSAGCSDNGQSGTNLTTVPATALSAKFTAGDIIAKTATSTDTFLLIVKYDASTDRYERALAYKKSDGTWYRKDDRTEVTGRSVIEKIYPAKVAHVVSLNEVPVVTPTAATTAPTVTITTTTTTSYPAPTVSSITPASGLAGTTVTITGISGTNFRSGASVRLTNVTSPSTIFGSSVTAQSASNITCLFSIPVITIAGTWNVTVTNIDGKSGTLGNAFTITNTTTTATTATTAPPAITVTSITPNIGVNGTMVSITNLSGTNFQTGATVNLTRLGSQNITASGVLASTSQIICTFALPSDAPVGSWNVVVTNPGGQSGTLANGFTVKNPAPIITSIIPNSNVTGLPVDITDLEGLYFQPGATVKLHSESGDISATNVVVSATKITCTFDLGGASAGSWAVVVTNPDTQSVTFPSGFSVISP